MSYNITQLQSVSNMQELLVYANDSTGQVFIGLLMMTVFFIMLMTLKKYSFENALATSGFVCFILSGMLFYSGLLTFWYPLIFLLLTSLTGFYLYVSR